MQAIGSPWVTLAFVPAAIVYILCLNYYRATSREVQRLDSISKSPIFNVKRDPALLLALSLA